MKEGSPKSPWKKSWISREAFHAWRYGLALALSLFLVVGAADAQAPQCDPGILSIAQPGAHGYRPRGDRCEGIYRPEVTDPTLWIAAFYRTFEDFSPTPEGRLSLTWESPVENAVRIQAQSVKLREFYRMDTQRAPDSANYQWPTALLAARDLGRRDIGLRAFTLVAGKVLYLPLRIGQPIRAADDGPYTLVMVPNIRLSDVLVSVARVESAGDLPTAEAYIRTNVPLPQSIFITQKPISITVDDISRRGTYVIEVTAIAGDGEALRPKRVWFYHGGE